MTRAVLRFALACVVAVALLAWMTRGVDWYALAHSVRPVPWWGWTATVVGLCASYLFRALRIRAELRAGHDVAFGPCLRVMLVHNAAINVVPMRGGEAAYPWLLHRTLGIPVAHAVASLIWMRAQDVLILAVAVIAAWPGLPLGLRLLAVVVWTAGVLVALRLLRVAGARPAPSASAPRLVRALHGSLHALSLAPRHGVAGWIWCAASWTVKLCAIASLLALAAGLPIADAMTGALGGELAGVLPVQGPAGFGTYEAGVWAGATLRGRTALEIAAPAVCVHLVSLATALAAGAIAHSAGRRRAAIAQGGTP